MKALLRQLSQQGIFSELDYYFASSIAHDNDRYLLLAALVSRSYTFGHIALPLEYLYQPREWLHEENIDNRQGIITLLLEKAKITRAEDWQETLNTVSSPLHLTKTALYLEKNFDYETAVVNFIHDKAKSIALTKEDITFLQTRLDHYFGENREETNWQKIAAANTLSQRISIISGGPGTGKTTTVFKILLILIEYYRYQHQLAPIIVLAAPTGKAAARMMESINQQRVHLTEKESTPTIWPDESVTLHRLLGISSIKKVPRYDREHPLTLDLLIIDEASMIDLQLMVQIIEALPAHARLILLGDKNQLSSVEAGSLMYELCKVEQDSQAKQYILSQLITDNFPSRVMLIDPEQSKNEHERPNEMSFDYLSVLKKSYRFSKNSALGQLSVLINREDLNPQKREEKISQLFNQENKHSIVWVDLPMTIMSLKEEMNEAFSEYLQILKNLENSPESIFAAFNRVRVLATQKSGSYGTFKLNDIIAETLFPDEQEHFFYHGLSIMIEQNDYEYGLFNGDIGLILNHSGLLRAYFQMEKGIQSFSIHALPKFEKAFAMTVHKSQGSEFNHVLLFLGDYGSAFLTKELLYTGVTRARQKVTLFSAKSAFTTALRQKTQRFSCIHNRLIEKYKS